MSVENLVGQSWHGKIYTGIISQYHQQWVSKGSIGLWIPIIGRVIAIWDKLSLKIRVYFYGMVSRKKVLSESRKRIETHLDVVLEVLEVHISVAFELCIDEDYIYFWWDDIMFESPQKTIYCRMSTLQWWSLLVIRNQSGKILSHC